ncbi:MAG: thioredoxin family protein [Planctomycetes bacterium]|nr:thioredoxin family protein [Planctomycetota bacterium]
MGRSWLSGFLAAIAISIILNPAVIRAAEDDSTVETVEIPDRPNGRWTLDSLPKASEFDDLLNWEIEDLNGICDLTPEQKQNLRLGGQKDIQQVRRRVERLRETTKDGEHTDANTDKEIAAILMKFGNGIFDENSMFTKVRKQILNSDQTARFEADQKVEVNWLTPDIPEAKSMSLKLNRPILIFFHLQESAPSKTQQALLNSPDLRQLLRQHFLCVGVDVNTEVAAPVVRDFKITGVPSIVILSPKGEQMCLASGLLSGNVLRSTLNYCRLEAERAAKAGQNNTTSQPQDDKAAPNR